MSEKHTKKVKKLKKKAKTHRHEGKPIPEPVQPPPFFHHEAEKRGHAPGGNTAHVQNGKPKIHKKVDKHEIHQQQCDQRLEEEDTIQHQVEENIDSKVKGMDINEFKLRFKRSVLLFHYDESLSKIPIYLKGSVMFIVLLEKLHKILNGKVVILIDNIERHIDFSYVLQEAEKQFIADMNLYLTYFSLISATQTIHLKKIFHQKGAESLHTKRAAHMAKVFHLFLKKNHTHWG